MSDDPSIEPARKGTGILGIVGWLAVVLALYVLSVGPVARFYTNKVPPQSIQLLYGPLMMLSDNVRPAEKFFKWYVRIWTKDK